MSKSVLVSYLERNKKFTIPSDRDVLDIQYLRKEFLNANDRNVNLVVTFQAYEKDWDAYVEIEEHEDIPNKSKVMAVVMPVLQESCSTPSVFESKTSKKVFLHFCTLPL